MQHYVIKFVSDLRHVRGFLRGTPVSSTNKTGLHDLTKILLKMALSQEIKYIIQSVTFITHSSQLRLIPHFHHTSSVLR
jgi:hypothetical protein